MALRTAFAPDRHRDLRHTLWRLALGVRPRHPAQVVATAFALGITLATVLLMLPEAHVRGDGTTFLQALFTATSAVCVTGLTVVDTARHWTPFGQAVILLGIQVGGLGIMTLASLLGLLVSRRLGLRSRLLAQSEAQVLRLGDVRRVVVGVIRVSLLVEALTATVLTGRFLTTYHEDLGSAVWRGVFHAVSAFNNAGFGLASDNLVAYVGDPWVCLPIALAVILGGLGFPVLFELRRELGRPRVWSMHTKVTLLTTALLLVGGSILVTAFEWTNARTLGPLSWPDKLLAGFFQGVQPRTAGFNSVDYGAMHDTTWLVTDALMFIGGGSASTAGGIKVTTFMVLFFAIVAEARGDPTVDVFHRAIPAAAIRVAISVALLGVALVFFGTLLLLALSDKSLDQILFECISAFGTVGLSTGITATLPDSAKYVLVVLMFLGRIGTVTAASALALRERTKLYSFPEERPIVG
jgi:trk system potassium uptake protein